ncbi:MAG: DUF3185 family protein [Clostridiales bacterium]|jgi:uncharacterized membrane protein HdeD (DUF308 family)|nr:DUF3185 family protein [Clostridiales bacterium]
MLIIGIILAVAGLISTIYGFTANNSWEAQLSSILSSGTANPGTIFIIIGIVALIAGIILIVLGAKKKTQ